MAECEKCIGVGFHYPERGAESVICDCPKGAAWVEEQKSRCEREAGYRPWFSSAAEWQLCVCIGIDLGRALFSNTTARSALRCGMALGDARHFAYNLPPETRARALELINAAERFCDERLEAQIDRLQQAVWAVPAEPQPKPKRARRVVQ